ncbi:hypothetical protein [Nonomuraea sp. KM90]|uniref:hypothetical protein n=1 Tax=Nonomuraea sp. KM90 TaxID=3457428 RepID=UPI003FCD9A75
MQGEAAARDTEAIERTRQIESHVEELETLLRSSLLRAPRTRLDALGRTLDVPPLDLDALTQPAPVWRPPPPPGWWQHLSITGCRVASNGCKSLADDCSAVAPARSIFREARTHPASSALHSSAELGQIAHNADGQERMVARWLLACTPYNPVRDNTGRHVGVDDPDHSDTKQHLMTRSDIYRGFS